jgi:acetyl-CoA carboxylase biotin carboxylase subunit
MTMRKILIANRGEIALRIIRTCKEMGIQTVAVHSTADTEAMHVRMADEAVCIGPPPPRQSYLNSAAIISAAEITGADAIHPGYGFLSENADFVDMVTQHDIGFIGPSADHIRLMGNKITAKKTAKKIGLPVVPGPDEPIKDLGQAKLLAKTLGYPVLLKAASGGGGRGMRRIEAEQDLDRVFDVIRAEARAAFGDETIYMEKFFAHPSHIEVQILGDQYGHVLHFGERDCSMQRHHQKVIEEAPSALLNQSQRDMLGDICVAAMKKLKYQSLGTLEFLYQDGEFYFIEMNTRLQVEHPVTEAITGFDLVKLQLECAAGFPLAITQDDIQVKGHAIECRINAEDSWDFTPSPGKIQQYHQPGGRHIRVDSALYAGYHVPSNYDSMVAKIITHGDNRMDAIAKMQRALDEMIIAPVVTNIPLHQHVLAHKDFQKANFDTKWLEMYVDSHKQKMP